MGPQTELTLEDSLKQVLGTLPPVIRDYITQEKYTAAAQNLMRQYKLRIDQGGVLERELLLPLRSFNNWGLVNMRPAPTSRSFSAVRSTATNWPRPPNCRGPISMRCYISLKSGARSSGWTRRPVLATAPC